ncbi:MAG TPA: heparin lyase I family protein [Actinoplanes sp.]|jgi:hypothetical protein
MPRSHARRWLAVEAAVAAVGTTAATMPMSWAASPPAVLIDTATHKESGFSDGSMGPFRMCTTQKPNYGQVGTVNNNKAMEFVWTAAGYDGTRMDRGAEACSDLEIRKQGWYGFKFLLPDQEFPRDKDTIIGQIFNLGGCKSWAATLLVRNNELWFEHRAGCATPTSIRLDADIRRDRWLPITIHFTVSKAKAGQMEIWYKDAPRLEPTYRVTGISFASWGVYTGDEMANLPDNYIGLKFGMYCADAANYTPNETRKIWFDNVSQLDGNPANAFDLVNPIA